MPGASGDSIAHTYIEKSESCDPPSRGLHTWMRGRRPSYRRCPCDTTFQSPRTPAEDGLPTLARDLLAEGRRHHGPPLLPCPESPRYVL
eukprot:scaffold1619_cov292-Pavlova_lutheri.AAC.17